MQITVAGQNIAITEALKDYAEKKIGKIDHFFTEGITNGKVEMVYHKTKSPEKSCEAKVIIHVHGAILSAREENSDMYAAIDLLFEKIEKQLKKYKDKLKDRKGEKISVVLEDFNKEDEDRTKDNPIVYVNTHSLKPMSIEEASLQLQLQKNMEFIVFTSDITNQMNVIYRRKDGDFGLIEPE